MRELTALDARVLRECRAVLERSSKSFALAAKLLPPEARDRAAAVYAFCRRVDDAIDEAPRGAQEAALAGLWDDLARIYDGAPVEEPALRAFQAVVRRCALPRRYPAELIEGMAMDVRGTRYETLEELLVYCHRVAGVVGLMMCHVFGIRDDAALHNAAHLGLAMQLTNICRDVEEDYRLGRVYLPATLLRAAGAHTLPDPQAGPFPRDRETLAAIRRVTAELLATAERYYASADRGIPALPFRAGLAVRAARMLYREIGVVVAEREHDPLRGRAVVTGGRKLELVGGAIARQLRTLPAMTRARLRSHRARTPEHELSFPELLA